MGHVGLTPQSLHAMGGFQSTGKDSDAAEQLVRDARAVEAAGAFAIVLEGIPRELAALITRELRIPTIGIGAVRKCDGQILVIKRSAGSDIWASAEICPSSTPTLAKSIQHGA